MDKNKFEKPLFYISVIVTALMVLATFIMFIGIILQSYVLLSICAFIVCLDLILAIVLVIYYGLWIKEEFKE